MATSRLLQAAPAPARSPPAHGRTSKTARAAGTGGGAWGNPKRVPGAETIPSAPDPCYERRFRGIDRSAAFEHTWTGMPEQMSMFGDEGKKRRKKRGSGGNGGPPPPSDIPTPLAAE